MAMRKLFNGKKRKLDGVDGNVTKSFKMFKIKSLKKNSYFVLVLCSFWPARYWEVIFTGKIQTGLELSVL